MKKRNVLPIIECSGSGYEIGSSTANRRGTEKYEKADGAYT